MRLRKALSRFIVARQMRGLSPATVKLQTWHLERLIAGLIRRDLANVSDVRKRHLQTWAAELHERWSPATVRSAITSARVAALVLR